MNDGTKDQFLCLLAKVHHDMHTIHMRSPNQMTHTTELPPGRPTAVLTGLQQVDVLT